MFGRKREKKKPDLRKMALNALEYEEERQRQALITRCSSMFENLFDLCPDKVEVKSYNSCILYYDDYVFIIEDSTWPELQWNCGVCGDTHSCMVSSLAELGNVLANKYMNCSRVY